MAKQEREKIEYEFEDLRRNTDPVPAIVLAQHGFDTDEEAERQEGKKRNDSGKKTKTDDDEDELSRRDADDDDDDLDADDDEDVVLSRKELARQLTKARRDAERNAQRKIDAAKEEAGEVIGKLQKRVDGIERRGRSDDIDAEFGPKIQQVEADLEAAMEAGDSKKVIALQKQLGELTADRKIKVHQSTLTTEKDEGEPAKPKILPRAQEWLDEQDWWDDPEQAHVKAYVNKLDGQLRKKGYDPNDDDYYELLEKKLDEKFPGVVALTMGGGDGDEDDDDLDDIPDKRRGARDRQRRAANRSPVNDGDGGARGSEGKRRERGNGKIELTRSDVANMRAFGLDPENPKHVEEMVAEKRRHARAQR